MKTSICPRCHGTGTIEEDGTCVGLGPFQDRPSTVDDEKWALADQDVGDPTEVRDVPVFTPPKNFPPKIASPRPPPDYTRVAKDSERPTALIHRRSRLLDLVNAEQPKHTGRRLLFLLFVIVGFGVAAGLFGARWLHVIQQHIGAR